MHLLVCSTMLQILRNFLEVNVINLVRRSSIKALDVMS